MSLRLAERLLWKRVCRCLLALTKTEEEIDYPLARRILKSQIDMLCQDVAKAVYYQMEEAKILDQRLHRLYDPGMALSEAKNRADALKLGERPVVLPDGDVVIPKLTAKQEMALEFQRTGKLPIPGVTLDVMKMGGRKE